MYLSISARWGLISPSISNESNLCWGSFVLNAHLVCVVCERGSEGQLHLTDHR